jgi:hypothetical protein
MFAAGAIRNTSTSPPRRCPPKSKHDREEIEDETEGARQHHDDIIKFIPSDDKADLTGAFIPFDLIITIGQIDKADLTGALTGRLTKIDKADSTGAFTGDDCAAWMEPCQILMMVQRLSTFSLLLESIGIHFAYFACFAYFAYLCSFHQALFARVTAGIWVLVLFHVKFMIRRGIASSPQKIMPKLIPKSDADVDDLLNCKLQVKL